MTVEKAAAPVREVTLPRGYAPAARRAAIVLLWSMAALIAVPVALISSSTRPVAWLGHGLGLVLGRAGHRLGSVLAWFWRPRLAAAIGSIALIVAVLVAGNGVGYSAYLPAPVAADSTQAEKPAMSPDKLRSETKRLRSRLRALVPGQKFIVVDHVHNRIYLREGETTLLDAVCSTGSGFVLTDGERTWVFDTPMGRFKVRSKTKNPVWKKPDWAFVEEGQPIPTDPSERMDPGALGEYALYLGNGYLIHGTLYERLLGRSVTHGCIRVGRDDLRVLYKSVDVGTPVFIF